MNQYHKIYNIFKRDITTNKLIMWEYYSAEVEWLSTNEWVATEKVDGTNIRIIWDGKSISFGGKTDRAQLHKDLVSRLEELFSDKVALFDEKFGEKEVCFYGEGYGAGIQKGGKYQEAKDFVMFDVNINGIWLNRGDVEGIAEAFGVKTVPVVATGTLTILVGLVSKGLKSQWGDFIAEGIVCRPKVEFLNKAGERIIIKIKDRDFRHEADNN